MSATLTVPLAPGLWRVRLQRDWINGFILRDDDGQVTLLDMGVTASGPKVLAALTELGLGPSDVTRLLLTHAHPDHAGGAAFVSAATRRGIDVHEEDADCVRAGQSPPRDPRFLIGRIANRLNLNSSFAPIEVAEELHDGQVLPVAGGLRVIHTPGHSPGHVSYLHEPTGTLITGDAIFNIVGLTWPIRYFCADFAMTKVTARRLAEVNYEVAAFTHGKELRDRARSRIVDFLHRHGSL